MSLQQYHEIPILVVHGDHDIQDQILGSFRSLGLQRLYQKSGATVEAWRAPGIDVPEVFQLILLHRSDFEHNCEALRSAKKLLISLDRPEKKPAPFVGWEWVYARVGLNLWKAEWTEQLVAWLLDACNDERKPNILQLTYPPIQVL